MLEEMEQGTATSNQGLRISLHSSPSKASSALLPSNAFANSAGQIRDDDV
jgi:hypothetical protein